jgi:hypothetical protein
LEEIGVALSVEVLQDDSRCSSRRRDYA